MGGSPVKLFRPTAWSTEEVDALRAVGLQGNGGPRISGGASEPGVVLRAAPGDGVLVATAAGAVSFSEAQPQGKRRMSAADWINGRGVEAGQRFE